MAHDRKKTPKLTVRTSNSFSEREFGCSWYIDSLNEAKLAFGIANDYYNCLFDFLFCFVCLLVFLGGRSCMEVFLKL